MEPLTEHRHVGGCTDTTLPPPAVRQKFFDPKPGSVRLARDFATTLLGGWGLDGAIENVRLCVSELASNALAHGTRRGHGFLVRLKADDALVRLELHDSRDTERGGERRPVVLHPAETETAGRGLLIVDILADGWGVEERMPFGKIVWADFKSAPMQPPGGGAARPC